MKVDPKQEALFKAAVNNSPYYKHLGMELTGYDDNGSVMEMRVEDHHFNLWASMHGGAISGLIDSSCGTAGAPYMGPNETMVTLDLRVQFLKPIRKGLLTAHGRVVHKGGRHIITESEVRNEDGDLMARGGGIHILINKDAKQG